jgi:hypothetical protein
LVAPENLVAEPHPTRTACHRLSDETGEWEVIGRPYTTAGGKAARVRTEIRVWRARARQRERATAEEGKR